MEDFHFTIPYRVRIADINYGGHLGNSAVLDIFQEVRIAFLAELGSYTEFDVGGCGIILSEAHVYFRAEMFLADELQVSVRCKKLKRTNFVLEYRIERNGLVTADGETTAVCFDYQERKPCRVPEAFRDALIKFAKI